MENCHMVEISRNDLYERVWAEPAVKLAKEFGVSGPALAKACRKHSIPVPERGYWARLAAGKRVAKRPLPPRGLGMPSTIRLGKDRYGHPIPASELDPDAPPPTASQWAESVEDVRARVIKLVGNVRPQATLQDAVPAVRHYVEADDERRRKMAESKYYWDTPKFESLVEQRRLRILNSLFLGSMKHGFAGSISGADARELSLRVGEQHVGFTLEPMRNQSARQRGPGRPPKEVVRLRLSINRRDYPGGSLKDREDRPGQPLEASLAGILVDLLVTGEEFHRDGEMYRHKWILERREEELRERRERAEEEERQRVAAIEAAKRSRENRLLRDAAAWRRAQTIRGYVTAAKAAYEARGRPGATRSSPDSFVLWVAWARTVADELDPLRRSSDGFVPEG